VTHSGKIAGSVSGGCVESDMVERAREVLDSGRPVMATYGIAEELGVPRDAGAWGRVRYGSVNFLRCRSYSHLHRNSSSRGTRRESADLC
jgi:hypothetical protein